MIKLSILLSKGESKYWFYILLCFKLYIIFSLRLINFQDKNKIIFTVLQFKSPTLFLKGEHGAKSERVNYNLIAFFLGQLTVH